jgi:2-dehydropantoate 2-reductase
MIGIVSYFAPLPGETVPRPGCAYWFPPLMESAIVGPRALSEPVAAALARGGCPASWQEHFPVEGAFGSPILGAHIAALEAAGWSLPALRRGPLLKLASRALRETHAMLEARLGVRRPFALRLVGPWFMRVGLKLAPCFVPFDLEQYLKAHFTKVGEQTRLGLRTEIEIAKKLGTPTAAMEELFAKLPPMPAKPA